MKRLSIYLLLFVFWITGAVHASTWTIEDNYIGGTIQQSTIDEGWVHDGGDVIALSDEVNYFNIDFMNVAIATNGDVTVEIQTGYTDGRRSTNYGDLFISTDQWDTDGVTDLGYWEYALNTPTTFEINGNSSYGYGSIYNVNQNNILSSNDVMSALSIASDNYRNDQAVLYDGSGDNETGTFDFSHAGSLISYAFNLSTLFGDDWSWEDELDLGFHWTMTCANDVIQGGLHKAAVPEPGTMLLLGMGIAGLGAAGRKRFKK